MKHVFKILFIIVIIDSIDSEVYATPSGSNADRITLIRASKTLKAPQALGYKWYLNNRLLEATTNEVAILKAGTYRVEMVDESGETKSLSISIALNVKGDPIVIHTIGDSTVQEYTGYYYPRKGWGQVLQLFFDEANVVINNEAKGGTSSKSFYDSFWPSIRASLDSGDFVFIGFGINDNNPSDPARYTIAETTFKEYLTKFVEETQTAGAYPVIVSTVRRNAWLTDTTVYDAYHGYPIASRELADSLDIPLIDLDAKSKELMEELHQQYCTYYWYMNLEDGEYPTSEAYSDGSADNVHFQEMGAIEMARLVVEELQNLAGDEHIDTLLKYLKPAYKVTVNSSVDSSMDEYGGLITRTASYPEGTNVTLKVRPEKGCEFVKWSNATVDSLTNNELIQFTMGAEDTSYTANFYYPPRLEILNPLNSDEFELGRDIILNVYAHQVSDTNSKLIVYEGATEIARIDTAPYIDTLKGVSTGTHTYIAKAYNILGGLMESPAVTFTVDNGYPHIMLDKPAGDAFYQLEDTLKFAATAYDSDGTLDTVKFYMNDEVIATLTEEPYTYEIADPQTGIYVIYATAIDNDGNITQTGTATVEVGPMTTFQELEDGYCGITNNLGTIDTNHLDFTGSGFINVDNVEGTTVNFTVNFNDTGIYKIVFRYSATSARPGDLKINGAIVGTVPFPATATWDVWDYSSANYTAADTGNKPVSIIATGTSGLPNIDYMKIISMESSLVVKASSECLEHPVIINVHDNIAGINSFNIYPVPAKDFVILKALNKKDIQTISFYSLNGRLVKSINNIKSTSKEISCTDLSSGLYIIEVIIGNDKYFRKLSIVK